MIRYIRLRQAALEEDISSPRPCSLTSSSEGPLVQHPPYPTPLPQRPAGTTSPCPTAPPRLATIQFHWRVPLLQGSRRVHCLPRRGEWSCARLRCATADDGPASPVRRDSACPGLAPGIARSPDCHTHPPGCLRGVSNPHAHHPRNHVEDRLRPWPAKCVCSRQGGMVVHVKRNADSL
jgi:hypothetical protein